MRLVPVKSEATQGAAMVFPVRELLVRLRTQTINALRDDLREFGQIVPQGVANAARLIATAIAVLGPPPDAFRTAQDFAARFGLAPRQHSTGGKQRLGPKTKMGEPVAPSQLRERSLRPPYCSSDGERGGGASMTNLSRRASFHATEKIAPANRGIKHLALGQSRAVFLDRQPADAPVLDRHLVDDDEGGAGFLCRTSTRRPVTPAINCAFCPAVAPSRVILRFT